MLTHTLARARKSLYTPATSRQTQRLKDGERKKKKKSHRRIGKRIRKRKIKIEKETIIIEPLKYIHFQAFIIA